MFSSRPKLPIILERSEVCAICKAVLLLGMDNGDGLLIQQTIGSSASRE